MSYDFNLLNEYLAAGWRVAPFVKTNEGYIGCKAWPKRAAQNMADLQLLVEELAAKSAKPPIYGIVPNKGQYVVDIDTKKNTGALALWKSKVEEACNGTDLCLPQLIVKTKSAGYHLYYSDGSDKTLHSPTAIFGKESGIDIRGYTGMVVAPTYVGTDSDWSAGEYCVIRGRPSDKLTVLPLNKILTDISNEEEVFIKNLLKQLNEILRNASIGVSSKASHIPDGLIIPASNRDNTLYKATRLCLLAGLEKSEAINFMASVALRCEIVDGETQDQWIKLAIDKVGRVYSSESAAKIKSISGFYEELDNAGTVMLNGISKSYYFFRHGSKALRIPAQAKYSTDNFANVLQGTNIESEDGSIPAKKLISSYQPAEFAYSDAMYPKEGLPFFEFDKLKYVNTYVDPFAGFEPDEQILADCQPYVVAFEQLIQHIVGHDQADALYLGDKLAWILQRPYRRLPTGTIIFSHTRGSGKDVFMGLIRELVGRQYYMPITLQSIEDPHTTMHDKLVCCASEVQIQTNARGNIAAAKFMGLLKDRITAKHVYVNQKFVQGYAAPIFANIFLLSNFELSSFIEPGDRRMDVFHATEEKLDQSRFGALADLTNDGIWIERSAMQQDIRRHAIHAIRASLINRQIDSLFDRNEARLNEVKEQLMANHNPPTVDWMVQTLPDYFTEEVVMMACRFCPTKAIPEFILKQLREHLGIQFKPLYRTGRTIYRMNGAPKLEVKSTALGDIPALNFDIKTSDPTARKPVYCIDRQRPRSVMPTDADIRAGIRRWYDQMNKIYYGNIATLPGQKPDGAES